MHPPTIHVHTEEFQSFCLTRQTEQDMPFRHLTPAKHMIHRLLPLRPQCYLLHDKSATL